MYERRKQIQKGRESVDYRNDSEEMKTGAKAREKGETSLWWTMHPRILTAVVV